jgi:hypothetical protein
MLDEILEGIKKEKYAVIGFDLSSGELYPIEKNIESMKAAIEIAAKKENIKNVIWIYDSDKRIKALLGTF